MPAQTLIDFTFDGQPAPTACIPQGRMVQLEDGTSKAAELVIAGEVIIVNGQRGSVVEVGSVPIDADGVPGARTILS